VNALVITRFTLQEAVARRVIVAGALLSLAFLALYAVGFSFMYGFAATAPSPVRPNVPPATVVFGNVFTVLGMYAIHFLSSFLALFLSVGAIAAEVESGTLHAILARPIRRWEFVLGRWLAGVLLIALYVGLMAGLVLGISWWISGYEAPRPIQAIGLMVLGAVLLLTLGLLGSTLLSTLANGVVVFTLFGLAWLAGIIEFIGAALPNESMVNVGIAVGLLIPSDTLWRAASYFLQSPIFLAAAAAGGGRAGIPFMAMTAPSGTQLVWAALYPLLCLGAAVLSLARRDL
jgi:ABC-type transport system involved in multi-copper enzyme maturation permease subunit